MSETGDDKSQQTRRRPVGNNNSRIRNNNRRANNNNNNNFNRPNRRPRAPPADETELASEILEIEIKRISITVRENTRGRFLKIIESGNGGRNSRIHLSIPAALEFKVKLAEFVEANSILPVPEIKAETSNTEASKVEAIKVADAVATQTAKIDTPKVDKENKENILKTDTMIKDQKRYYLDLKENERGRFLRISMVISRGPRSQIVIPAQGLVKFQEQFVELLTKFNNLSDEDLAREAHALSLSESKALKTDNKSFYFDLGSNAQGSFLKISEVKLNQFKTSITLPGDFIEKFRDHLTQFIEKVAENSNASLKIESEIKVESKIVA